jgi:hypothetical protein
MAFYCYKKKTEFLIIDNLAVLKETTYYQKSMFIISVITDLIGISIDTFFFNFRLGKNLVLESLLSDSNKTKNLFVL